MQEIKKNESSILSRLRKYLCDPVLIYSVLVMMSIMYHYRPQLTPVYGLATFAAAFLLFRLFDFMLKHQIIGGAIYCISAGVCFIFAKTVIELGQIDYPISFWLWFITPQVAIEYNSMYTLGTYMLFMFFMTSVIYYFTRVRYRILMSFVVMIIPFAIYGKENETMPIPFIILLSVGYMFMMVFFRQLRDGETITVTSKVETWMTVGVYLLVFASATAVIPKPEPKTDRSMLESMISADRFTDKLLGMLSSFRNTSTGGQYRAVNDSTPLYFVKADRDIYFKTATYSEYLYLGDTWKAMKCDNAVVESYDECPIKINETGMLTEAILKAAECDRSFAEKYGLSEFVGKEIYISPIEEAEVYSVFSSSISALVPERVVSLEEIKSDTEINLLKSGQLESDDGFGKNEIFRFKFSSEDFLEDETNYSLIEKISDIDNYKNFLYDASVVLKNASGKNDKYYELYSFLEDEEERYGEYTKDYLDYGNNKKIRDLAMEITKGCKTDLEKAVAIELYFFTNGYTYDMNYVKSRAENVENFLFTTKRGVCYEYATAMVLLSRAAGIPARYCEGFMMKNHIEETVMENGKTANYLITPNDAHGFPELYINGYGWRSFEPTITTQNESKKEKTLAESLMKTGIFLSVLLVLIIVFIICFPFISHKFFLLICRRKSPNETAVSVMMRIRKIYGISDANTSHEVMLFVFRFSGADISNAAEYFDEAAYGEIQLGEQHKLMILSEYKAAYDGMKAGKKSKRSHIKDK